MEPDLSPRTARYESDAAVSWPAVFAGAVTALALSIVLSVLVAGFGMKIGSTWLATRGSLAAFTPTLGALAIAVQVVANGVGGYLAGRLRTKWSVHGDEAHFRDTAHGLLVWAVATVAGVVLAALVLVPYATMLEGSAVQPVDATDAVQAIRLANIAAQSSFFVGVGLLLSGFTAAVAAAVGGARREEMHAKV